MGDLVWVPQSCTLPTEERPLRVAEWDTLLAERMTSLSRPALRLSLSLAAGPDVEEAVRDLLERESGCCSFFAFTVSPGEDVIGLDIEVGPEHESVLDALVARAALP
ncbi:hypothetical protein [Streptomyces sp. AP-93]|uniref:hypothetical protein n=1 Tax=Streptomyces sp. AP-93 TaxID=2929048 RepID=UPI001FAE785E|nr:hypothetical protein [Streptomyces sp. AP-93]MCJ0868614.1 hypothetical protein [Streptomyces sp. AP-93]